MKRLCTESEKELLYKNREQMLKGIFQTASHSKFGPVYVSLFISIILTFTVVIFLGVKFGNRIQITESKIKLGILILFFACEIVVSGIMNALRVKKEAKLFTKQKNIMINGATIVAVDAADKFSYIEDDVKDEDGRPIIIDYPSCAYDIMPEDIGKRILVLYGGDSDFQLVKLNDELKGMIPNGTSDYPLAEGIEQYTRLPHPNMAKIEKEGHAISENERASYADWHVNAVQGANLKGVKVCGIVIAVCLLIICIILGIDGIDGYPLSKSLPIATAIYAGMVLFYWLLARIGKWNIRRQGQFTYVKEVVFHSYIFQNNMATVKVYEWNQGQMQVCEYPAGNVAPKTAYGSVLYKFTNLKGKFVLMNASPISKG